MNILRSFIELGAWVKSQNLPLPRVILVWENPRDAAFAEALTMGDLIIARQSAKEGVRVRKIAGLDVEFVSEADVRSREIAA